MLLWQYHLTCLDTQLRKSQRLSPLIPYASTVSSEQVAHTTCSRPRFARGYACAMRQPSFWLAGGCWSRAFWYARRAGEALAVSPPVVLYLSILSCSRVLLAHACIPGLPIGSPDSVFLGLQCLGLAALPAVNGAQSRVLSAIALPAVNGRIMRAMPAVESPA